MKKSGYSPSKIFLIGFSQGACLAIDFALRLQFSIGGIVAIAGFIKFKERFLSEASNESDDTPILLMHGNQDDIIPIKAGEILEIFFNSASVFVPFLDFHRKSKACAHNASASQNFYSTVVMRTQ